MKVKGSALNIQGRSQGTARTGFTLVELLVSVLIVASLIVVITGVMMDTFKAKTRSSLADRVAKNGTFAISELRRNIINSLPGAITCPVGVGSSMVIYARDGRATTLKCTEGGAIASESALRTIDLTEGDVEVSGCSNFISCDTSAATGNVSQVNIGFTISSGEEAAKAADFVSRDFETKITVRD